MSGPDWFWIPTVTIIFWHWLVLSTNIKPPKRNDSHNDIGYYHFYDANIQKVVTQRKFIWLACVRSVFLSYDFECFGNVNHKKIRDIFKTSCQSKFRAELAKMRWWSRAIDETSLISGLLGHGDCYYDHFTVLMWLCVTFLIWHIYIRNRCMVDPRWLDPVWIKLLKPGIKINKRRDRRSLASFSGQQLTPRRRASVGHELVQTPGFHQLLRS